MARVFLARLTDYGCDFSSRSRESPLRDTRFSLVSKKRFFRFRRRLFNKETISVNLRKRAGCGKSESRVPEKPPDPASGWRRGRLQAFAYASMQ
ncbi:hypothetical protein [Burkholderia pseudomultivorans]|uniref:hypothetical protein n=1 Tax=Burkholderia pseudomultivorans TaxID=1207504 RepID=UPI0012D95B3F|nr:hypothetical protein [Burkholderia pseudomultivorans]